jgi:hypothetical protein
VATKTHLYVIGGIDSQGQYVKKVEYALLDENGDIGPWRTTSELNDGRFYLASVIVGKYLFVLGGENGPIGGDNKPISSVERSRINTDGSLSAWETVSHMQLPRRGLKAIAVGRRIYAIGGYSGVFLKSTEHVSVDEQGNLGNWEIDPQQAQLDRYIHSASYFDDRIYLLGGHVQRSDQISDGTIRVERH